jgi:lipopolysaccharide transport system ATP-binding protein
VMSSEVAIQVKNLSKCYRIYEKPLHRLAEFLITSQKFGRDYWALQNISFEVRRGETFGIIGRNGAGKSTLLQLISGTLSSTTGEINVNGRVAALLELGAGFNPEFTGRENVVMTASIYGLSTVQINERIDSIFKFAEIGDFVDQPVKTYSSGMYVRLAFAVIANVDADILIVDEALSVGDVRFQQKCVRFLESFKEKGGTLLFVSHDTTMVMALCEKVLYLNKVNNLHTSQTGKADDMCKAYLKDLYAEKQEVEGVDPNVKDEVSGKNYNKTIKKSSFNNQIKINSQKAAESTVAISCFQKGAESFGDGRGVIEDATFVNKCDAKVSNFRTGEKLSLIVNVKAIKKIKKPTIALILKDRTGQFIFSDGTVNAYQNEEISLCEGQTARVKFSFIFPNLIEGVYSMNISFADGTHLDHVTLHWIHDVLEVRVSKGRNVVGITGFSDLELEWQINE